MSMDKIEAFYHSDDISAVDARAEADKIIFAPIVFNSVLSLNELGILPLIGSSGEDGISLEEIMLRCGVSHYTAMILLQMALGAGIVKKHGDNYILGKIGYFLLEDHTTKVNLDFVRDICYDSMKYLTESLSNGKPEGLKALDVNGETLYQMLSMLSEKRKTSWLAFDHAYSDISFDKVLETVFSRSPKHIADIGGNTGRWALKCTEYDKDVKVTIIDMPGQVKMAEKTIKEHGLEERINAIPANVLAAAPPIPSDADAVWMSQFLDCFSLEEITMISYGIADRISCNTDVYVLEPLIDRQQYQASSYCLQAISLYFAAIANGNSRMYLHDELKEAIEAGGLKLIDEIGGIGQFSYSLLRFRKEEQP